MRNLDCELVCERVCECWRMLESVGECRIVLRIHVCESGVGWACGVGVLAWGVRGMFACGERGECVGIKRVLEMLGNA